MGSQLRWISGSPQTSSSHCRRILLTNIWDKSRDRDKKSGIKNARNIYNNTTIQGSPLIVLLLQFLASNPVLSEDPIQFPLSCGALRSATSAYIRPRKCASQPLVTSSIGARSVWDWSPRELPTCTWADFHVRIISVTQMCWPLSSWSYREYIEHFTDPRLNLSQEL